MEKLNISLERRKKTEKCNLDHWFLSLFVWHDKHSCIWTISFHWIQLINKHYIKWKHSFFKKVNILFTHISILIKTSQSFLFEKKNVCHVFISCLHPLFICSEYMIDSLVLSVCALCIYIYLLIVGSLDSFFYIFLTLLFVLLSWSSSSSSSQDETKSDRYSLLCTDSLFSIDEHISK